MVRRIYTFVRTAQKLEMQKEDTILPSTLATKLLSLPGPLVDHAIGRKAAVGKMRFNVEVIDRHPVEILLSLTTPDKIFGSVHRCKTVVTTKGSGDYMNLHQCNR